MMASMLAARAYASVQGGGAASMAQTAKAAGGAAADAGPDFASMVKGAMNDVVSTSKQAETQMMAHAQGKAELIDVVTAVSSAQASLETAMAVRDQVISAYKEIMAMPI